MRNENIENIVSVIEYIEAHLTEKLDLNRMADAVHYSKYHLHRMFTGAVGLTPHEYLQRRQLTEAAKPYFIYRRAKSVSLRAADGRGPIIATVDGECAPCKQVSVQVQPLAGHVLLPLPAYQRFTAKKAGVK